MAQHRINHRVCVFDLCGIKYKHKATSFFPVQVLNKLKNKIKSLEWRLKYYTYFKKALLLKNMASGHSNTPKLGRVFHSIFSTVGLGKAFHWHPPHKTTWRSRTENVLLWRQVSPWERKEEEAGQLMCQFSLSNSPIWYLLLWEKVRSGILKKKKKGPECSTNWLPPWWREKISAIWKKHF